MPSDPVDYRSPTTQSPRDGHRRSLNKWLILLVAWFVGVIVWICYLGLAGFVILHVL